MKKDIFSVTSTSEHKNRYLRMKYILPVLFCFISPLGNASKTDTLFLSDEIVRMEIRTDFSMIQVDRKGTPEYREGELTYFNSDGTKVNLSVRVRARGNFRRDPVNCGFPPLFVNFRKNEVKNTLFDNQDALKLVTPCQSEEDVIEEYLVYKMYNLVTDLSFKARLVKVLYFDTGVDSVIFEKFSFFIEDEDHLATRLNGIEIDKFTTPFALEHVDYARLSLFQFMIGNKDWFVTSRQNIVVVQPNDSLAKLIAIPYDFDFAGFINADYTKQKGVPENFIPDRRIYKGLCYSHKELKEQFEFFKTLKPEFISLINSAELLSKRSKSSLKSYLSYFYSIMRHKELVRNAFMENCETKKDYNIPE